MVRLQEVEPFMAELARRITGSHADGQDALQEAALAAYVARDQLRNPDRFSSWFRTILVHKCGDIVRKRPDVVSLDEHRIESTRPAPEHQMIWMLLDHLSKPCAQVLVLRYAADLPQKCIARLLGIPVGTVKSRLNRALENMRAMMEDEEVSRREVFQSKG